MMRHIYSALRWSEKYTKTDMVYLAASNFWLVVPRFVLLGIGMLLTIAFANLLSPHEYGTYKYVLALSGIIAAFSVSGMGSSVMREVAQGRPHVVPYLVRSTMLWSMPASIAAAGISMYYFLHGNHTLGFGLAFIAVANVLSNGYGLSKSVMVASGDFKANTLAGFPRAVLPIFLLIGTLFLTKNVVLILFVYFASNVVLAWSMWRYSIRHQHIRPEKASPHDIKAALTFGRHLSVLGFFMLLSGQINQVLLFHFSNAAMLATFTIALAPAQEAYSLLDNLTTIAFPKIAKLTREEIDRALPFRFKQMTVISIAVFIMYIVCIPVLFKLFFPKYVGSILVAQVLGLLILTQPFSIFDTLVFIGGNVGKRYKAVIANQIFSFGLYITLIPFFGLWGAVVATILSDLGVSLSYYIVYKARI